MSSSGRRSAAETREHVLAVADALFYARGVRATGVDVVAAEAGVAPTTLYRLFASKDDLVAAYVERAATRYRARVQATLDGAGPDPVAQVRAVFAALVTETDPALCRGCAFLLALAELPDPEHPGHRGVVAVKDWVRARLTALADEIVGDGEDLGEELTLVMEGVWAAAQVRRSVEPARRAQVLVDRILAAHRSSAWHS